MKFKKNGKNSLTFEFNGNDLMLKTEPSSNKVGSVVNLYQYVNGEYRKVKCIGWLSDDGKQGWTTDKSVIYGLTNIDRCKLEVIKYLEKILV